MVSVDSIPRSRYLEFVDKSCEQEIIAETHIILKLNKWCNRLHERKCGIRLRV